MTKTQKHIVLKNVFMMMMVLAIAMILGRRISFSHGLAPALFCVGVLMIGGVGTIVMIVLRNIQSRSKQTITKLKRNVRLEGIPEGDRVVWGVVDRSTRDDFWRCSMRLLSYRWQTYLLFFPPTNMCLVIALLIASQVPLVLGVNIAISIAIARILFIGHRIWSKYRVYCNNRYPRIGHVRTCTTTLTRMGYLNVTSTFKTFSPWADVGAIRELGNDIYIFHVDGGGIYITHNAFRDTLEAHEFKQKAIELWRNSMSMSMVTQVPASASAYQADVNARPQV